MPHELNILLAVPFALVAALLLTPLVRRAGLRLGVVSRPKNDRWARKTTPHLGGAAIFAAVALAVCVLQPGDADIWKVMGASAFLFAVGLVDDVKRLKPYQKLIGQIMGATLLIVGGLTLPWTSSALLNMALTLFWLVGITNALNLLDNMDGLAAGVAAIAALFLAVNFYVNDQIGEAVLLVAFAAVLIGFLFYNFNPASIFMGDSGSMFVGFFLASMPLLHVSSGRSRSLLSVLAVPVLLLLIPIFDTTFVTVLRKLAGRAASQGGRDHTSHRLVALGLSERRAVGLLYGLAALSGMLAMGVSNAPTDVSLILIALFTIGLTFLAIHLAGVKVYEEGQEIAPDRHPVVSFLVNRTYHRRVFEVLLDVALIGLAYYGANVLYYGPLSEDGAWSLLLNTLPLVIFLKLAAFLTMGVYRGLWRYIGINDLMTYVRAVAMGSVATVLVFLFLYRFESLSRVVFILDGLLLLVMVAGSRIAFRVLRGLLPTARVVGGRRALIYGAGDAGELLLREMRNNPDLGCLPIGFADDDPAKKGRIIHGLPVFGGNGTLKKICADQRVEEVYISSSKFTDERVGEIRMVCKDANTSLKRMRISFENLHDEDSIDLEAEVA